MFKVVFTLELFVNQRQQVVQGSNMLYQNRAALPMSPSNRPQSTGMPNSPLPLGRAHQHRRRYPRLPKKRLQ